MLLASEEGVYLKPVAGGDNDAFFGGLQRGLESSMKPLARQSELLAYLYWGRIVVEAQDVEGAAHE